MPLGPVLEFALQPILEAVLQIAGYLTACLIVPVFTLGRVHVESFESAPVKPKLGRVRRAADGHYVMEAELASLIGLLFWAVLAICVYLVVRFGSFRQG